MGDNEGYDYGRFGLEGVDEGRLERDV